MASGQTSMVGSADKSVLFKTEVASSQNGEGVRSVISQTTEVQGECSVHGLRLHIHPLVVTSVTYT